MTLLETIAPPEARTEAPTIPQTAEAPTAAPAVAPETPRPRPRWARKGIVLLLLAGGIAGGWLSYRSGFWRGENPVDRLPKMAVSRVDLSTLLTANGRVESSHNTIIACELERLEIRAEGQTVSSGGSAMILTLVPEGTMVKKGDLLCRVNSADYEELVRTQEIKLEQATAAMKQARLNFEVAEIAVREYREGLVAQNIQAMAASIALARSDFERASDRFEWMKKMLKKGYVSVAAKRTAERDLEIARQDILTSTFDMTNFHEYGSPKTLMELASEVEKRRFEELANTQRVTRSKERLDYYKLMVEKCSIVAPHDGFLIYAVDPGRPGAAPIEEGQTVRQQQKLFLLPDLAHMEVVAYLHESVAQQVHEGMTARARIEGLANRGLEGHVVSVAPLPTTAGNWISDEVKYFVSIVKLDSVPVGLKPGMTAEVEFDVDRRLDVLAVPSEAVAVEHGRNFCYVAGADGLERRRVSLGRSSRDFLEVTQGLYEGDQVVLRPEKVEAIDALLVNAGKGSDADEPQISATEAFAPSGAPASVD